MIHIKHFCLCYVFLYAYIKKDIGQYIMKHYSIKYGYKPPISSICHASNLKVVQQNYDRCK